MVSPYISGNQASFYYYASITPSTSSMTLMGMSPVSIVRDSGSVYVITYLITDIVGNSDRITSIQRTFCSPSSLLGSYQDVNKLTFNVIRGAYCTALEDYRPGVYCPLKVGSSTDPSRDYIRDFSGDNASAKCTRLSSTNPVHNDYVINCPGIAEMLDVSSTDTAAPYIRQQYATTCKNNTDLLECQCINRATKDVYVNTTKVLGTGVTTQSGNAMCWYTPCMFEPGIIVDYSLQNAYSSVKCPDICQNIIAIVNTGGNVNLKDVSLSTSCFNAPPATQTMTSSPKTTTPAPTTTTSKPLSDGNDNAVQPVNNNNNNPVQTNQHHHELWWWWLLVLLILPISYLFYHFYIKKKDDAGDTKTPRVRTA